MKMKEEILIAFNQALHGELQTAYDYEAMALWLRYNSLDGMAQWVQLQVEEERAHAQKMREYLEIRGAKVALSAIAQPRSEFSSALEVFEEVYKAEGRVAKVILSLRELALKHQDEGAAIFLNWYVTEQEEEEMSLQTILDKFALAGINHETKSGAAIYLLDKELGSRPNFS
ncbi:ferritin [Entomospira culicis]|uniref:Ferritin n=1 Tax=Entomospira culicis TaxID=2719989 RepID=A0A968KVK4_9SPIO|nr:ferritin [Entomospira culicis]NIZ19003.1 ferritin [Entomospira culicis]NIZ69218.1 ferritin [Entomospira culicis]WDI37803.1 ferritin [Entomospira culicis]WDI39431.1 ferritin [Entomospira culicis]